MAFTDTKQEQAAELLRAFNVHIGDSPAFRGDRERTAQALSFATRQALQALEGDDLTAAVTALADLHQTIFYALCAWGVDFEPVWQAYTASLDAKITDPDMWSPPDIAGVLMAQVQS